jgi:hypothetical protein
VPCRNPEGGHGCRLGIQVNANPAICYVRRVRPSRFLALYAVYAFTPLFFRQEHVASVPPQSAEAAVRRFEIGGQAIDMRTGGCFQSPRCDTPQFGIGGGVALNLNSHFALDSDFNVLPRSIINDGSFMNGSVDGGRASEFVAGVRAEARAKHYGFFLDAQPGFVSWSQVPTGIDFAVEPNGSVLSSYYTHARRTFFASKVGAEFESSPRSRLHVRVDFADLVIRYGHSAIWTCDTCVSWSNNPQITVGMYAGLGKSISWKPPEYNPRAVHSFWDASNLVLMGVGLLGISADAITTQRFISRGLVEGDPLARPLVKYGWSGQVAASGIEMTGVVLGMYGLHRINQHWIERLLPVCIGAWCCIPSGLIAICPIADLFLTTAIRISRSES